MIILSALLWIAATAVVISAALAIARRLGSDNLAVRVVHVIILAWTWLALAAVGLSVPSRLTGPALIATVTSLALSSLALALWRVPVAPDLKEPSDGTPRWAAVAWTALLALWAVQVATHGLSRFQTDFDSLMYHTPMVDYWLQARSLYAPDGTHWANPGAAELLGLWAVSAFPGDFLVTLANAPVAVLLAAATLELGRTIGLRPAFRHAAALAVVSNFVVFNQLVDTENDVAVAALFTACLCLGARFARSGRGIDLALGASAFGLLCGVKYYALGYASVAWAVAVALCVGHRGLRPGLRLASAWCLGAVLVGGYWYLRNDLASGSPFYPMTLGARNDVLHQEYPEPFRSSFLGNGRPEVWPMAALALWKMTGPCHFVAILLVPLTTAWLSVVGAVRGRGTALGVGGLGRLAVASATLGAASVLAVTPFALEDVPGSLNHLEWAYTPARYGLSFLSLAVVALALSCQDLATFFNSRRFEIGLVAFLVGSAAYQTLFVDERQRISSPDALGAVLLLFATSLIFLELRRRFLKGYRPTGAVIFCGAAAAAALTIADLAHVWDARFARHYEQHYNTYVFRKLAALGPTRLALLDYRCHPFFGTRRQFRLCQPKRVDSLEMLENYLRDRGVTHVVARTEEHGVPAAWDAYCGLGARLDRLPSRYRPIYQDRVYSLYEVRPTSTGPGPVASGGPGPSWQRVDDGRQGVPDQEPLP